MIKKYIWRSSKNADYLHIGYTSHDGEEPQQIITLYFEDVHYLFSSIDLNSLGTELVEIETLGCIK